MRSGPEPFDAPGSVALCTAQQAVPDARGRGLGRVLLDDLERHARELGYESLVLETGDRQEAALALYRGAGFVRRPCWPPYDSRAISLCFEKPI